MVQFSNDLSKTLDTDSIALIHSQWMKRVFELNSRTQTNSTLMNVSLEMKRIGISWNVITQPPEMRSDRRSL
jgi:hypothetical protein